MILKISILLLVELQLFVNHSCSCVNAEKTHAVLDDIFLVSDKIPRETAHENGVKFGMRFDRSGNEWISDEKIADERIPMCNVAMGQIKISGVSLTKSN